MLESRHSRPLLAGMILVGSVGAAGSARAATAGELGTTIDIAVPTVRGVAPAVTLVSSPNGGDGVLGLGWRLEVGGSARIGDERVSAFERVEHGGSEGHGRRGLAPWTVHYTDGRSARYETYDGGETWLLAREVDRRDSAVDYRYACTPGNECELVSIRWGDHGKDRGAEVSFEYEARPDIRFRAHGKKLVATAHRLRAITVLVADSPVRRYALAYTTSNRSGRSILASVSQPSLDALPSRRMPGEGTPPTVEAMATTKPAELGERPKDDDLALDVAQARIASKLFGAVEEVAVGRYKLLELVGRGGMGVVWGAWDPELERKVAIKLVDHLRTAARDRIVDEARALAKLSHPNVVPIYDVGVVDERVYLVMEWVAGESLRSYLDKPRKPREIVDIYLQAARGLAAVHAAGLVHRDFKPENAMMGRDGRVRVLDFGLARSDVSDAAGEIAGTPRYMAPEQRAGAVPTPAVDQFALGLALREGLSAGGREVPRWLAAIIARATAEKPADRFPSMDELIRALSRDPARVWRNRVLATAALAATAGAFAIGRAATKDACTATQASNALPAELRDRIAAHLASLGGFAANDRATLLALLDDHQRRWTIAHHAACVAHDRGELPTAMYERRLTCLARAESSLAATSEILENTTGETFPDARVAAGSLVDPDACVRVDQSLVPLPTASAVPAVRAAEAAIERARMLATAARPDAVRAAEAARQAAEKTEYAPVVAHALLVEGRAEMTLGDERAHGTLDRAMNAGFAAHDDASAIEAFARMAYLAAIGGAAVDGTSLIRTLAARLGGDGAFARLLLLNNLAAVKLAAGDTSATRALLEEAYRGWHPGQNADDYELVSIPQNLALVSVRSSQSAELLSQARAEAVRLVGAEHPHVIELDQARALFLGLEQARATTDAACERLARLFPHLRGQRASCEYEAGWLADEARDDRAASTHFAAAAVDAQPPQPEVAAAMADFSAGRVAPAVAARTLEELASRMRAGADSVWPRMLAADAFTGAARAFDLAGDRTGAARCWDAARVQFEQIGRPFTARRLARARTALALLAKDAATARAAAQAALAWYRDVGGYARQVGELENLLGKQ
jgi:serine/threonine protein kinase